MPFSHRLSRAVLSAAILLALVAAGYVADRHGGTTQIVHFGHWFVTTVQRGWQS